MLMHGKEDKVNFSPNYCCLQYSFGWLSFGYNLSTLYAHKKEQMELLMVPGMHNTTDSQTGTPTYQ
jgi:hypothetical protein